MFRPSIMVNPVYIYKARNRDVYFPKNFIWYDFYSGKIESWEEKLKMKKLLMRIFLFILDLEVLFLLGQKLNIHEKKNLII